MSVVEVEVFVRISDQGEVAFEFGAGNDHRGSAIVGVETQTAARFADDGLKRDVRVFRVVDKPNGDTEPGSSPR